MPSRIKFSGALYKNSHTFQIQGDITLEAREKLMEVAEMYKEKILEGIETNGWGMWNMDTLWYRKKKKLMKDAHDTVHAWVHRGDLLSHLTVKVTQEGQRRIRVWAGFEDAPHYSGYSTSELVTILDSRRPLIAPAWNRIEQQALDILGSIGMGVFRKVGGR